MAKALQQVPWFINGHYLSVRRWEPNFVASKTKELYSVVWVRLPQLPTEFYDGTVLGRIGNSIGKLLRIDVCTSSTTRERYGRLCVQFLLDQLSKLQFKLVLIYNNYCKFLNNQKLAFKPKNLITTEQQNIHEIINQSTTEHHSPNANPASYVRTSNKFSSLLANSNDLTKEDESAIMDLNEIFHSQSTGNAHTKPKLIPQ
ncbi:uncharacterized protein At4g02000-like [Nicotiana sylvestris]|uniref:uncharacterized protein At4g02000-like n=1 Tax=Nicotiana sylvestris TaxID=4096 RepID=UPI00388CB38F